MKLVSLDKYREMVYAQGSGPSLTTLRRRIKDIPGGRRELGRYYVDLDANDRRNQLSREAQSKLEQLLNDPLLLAMKKGKG
jgi:hypothetical protein